MEDIVCRHVEVVDSSTHIGTCRLCHQQVQYDEDERHIIRLIQRGSINGQQTMIRPPTVETKSKKEKEKAPEVKTPAPSLLAQNHSAPDKPKNRRGKRQAKYLEKNKEAILRDYRSLRLKDFLTKWHISSNTWLKLKRLWKVTSKGKGRSYTSPRAAKTTHKATKTEEKPQLTQEKKNAPFQTGPMNRRTGSRAIWRF